MSGLQDVCLVFVLDEHMSLAAWERHGLLGREMALYRELAKRLGKLIVVSYGGREDLRYQSRFSGIEIVCNKWGLKPRLYLALLPWLLTWAARGFSKRVVKTNQLPGVALADRIAERLGARLVIRCGYHYLDFLEREFGTNSRQAVKARSLEARYYPKAAHAIVTSASFRDRLIADYGLDQGRVSLIPNFVDTDLFNPQARQGERLESLAFIGRLAPQKNLHSLIEALQGLDVRLEVAGDGPLANELRELAERLGVHVRFHGRLSHEELPALLRSVDGFVLPSLFEGHPKSLLEAMAAGVAVIGADAPGIRECIRHGETGLLCQPTPQGLRAAVMALANDASLRARLGQNAAAHINADLSLAAALAKELKLYSDLTGGRA